jgi:hypothetical protein
MITCPCGEGGGGSRSEPRKRTHDPAAFYARRKEDETSHDRTHLLCAIVPESSVLSWVQ